MISSNGAVNAPRVNGAAGRTLFDCGCTAGVGCSNVGGGNDEGTPGSSSLETLAGGSYRSGISRFDSNVVSVGGNTEEVGDLFEHLTIRFDATLLAGGTCNFRADTDSSDFNAPPPTVVPEPSTYAHMASGLVGIGLMARRRRKV